MISLVKRCHMMCHVKNYQRCKGDEWTEDFDAREIEQFVCILILFCIGKKDTAKRKKVTITNRKIKNRQKKASTIFKTRSGPHNLNSSLSFLDSSFFCSETARKRLLDRLRTG